MVECSGEYPHASRRKTVIISEIIAPYRIPVFNALAKRNDVDLHAIFLAETDKALRQWRIYTDEIRFSYEVLRSWRLRSGNRNLLLNWGVSGALHAARPESIICGGYNYPASWQALRWARRRGVRFVLWIESNERDARMHRATVEWLKRRFVNACSAFVVPGKSSFAYVQALGANDQHIYLAPNAVDNVFFATRAKEVRRSAQAVREKMKLPARFILYAGRLVPEKGVFDLLEAYAKLERDLRSEVGLVFAGAGVSREELARRATQVSPGTVCFTGFAQREELAAFYALAEALVLPTHSDPWGLVVNEGMACGLPIVASQVAGCVADLVDDRWNGYVVSSGIAASLKLAIETLLRQPDLREQMGVRSAERIRHYTPEACAEGLAQASASAGGGQRWNP